MMSSKVSWISSAVDSMRVITVSCSSMVLYSRFLSPATNDMNTDLCVNVENWLLKHTTYSPVSCLKKRKLRNQLNLKWMNFKLTVKLSIKFIYTSLWHNYSWKKCVPFCVISFAYLSRIEFLDRRECFRWKVTRNKKIITNVIASDSPIWLRIVRD